jgi:hypothetical protein
MLLLMHWNQMKDSRFLWKKEEALKHFEKSKAQAFFCCCIAYKTKTKTLVLL